MIVLGIDQAPRNCGFCYGESNSEIVPKWGSQDFQSFGENGVLLCREIRKWVISICEIAKPQAVYCEQIIIRPNHINLPITYQQFAVVAGIEAACDFLGIECFMVDIGVWRKRFLGRGGAPKWAVDRTNWLKDAALKACADRGWLIDNHHAAEAAALWDFGCAHVDIEYRRRTAARVTRQRMAMEEKERAAA
jgi:hypothetical protein